MNQYTPPQAILDQAAVEGDITPAMVESLRKTKFGTRLVSVALYVATLFSVLGAVIVMFSFRVKGDEQGSRLIPLAFGGLYLVFALVYGVLATHLYRYGTAIADFVSEGHIATMEAALQHQQKFWHLAGRLVLVMLVFMLLGIAAAVVIPIMQR